MAELSLSNEQRERLYERVEELTPHSDLYFPDHIFPVARDCLHYGLEFQKSGHNIDPEICHLGGLTHDLGYREPGDHIENGIRITSELLEENSIPTDYADRITDCIWTHDGNLDRSEFATNGNPPLENIIVNDVDAIALFTWIPSSVIEFVGRLGIPEPEKWLIGHADETFEYIHHPYFKKRAEPFYKQFVKEMQDRINKKDIFK